MLANDYDFFNIFNIFPILVENNDLSFNKFITNYKTICYGSNSNK